MRTTSSQLEAIKNETSGLLTPGAFEYVNINQLLRHANIPGGRVLLKIKKPGKKAERYNARFIVQGHKDKENEYLTHIYNTFRHNNIKKPSIHSGNIQT